MSGPFSIAHNKLKHVMSSVDDIDQDKVLEGVSLVFYDLCLALLGLPRKQYDGHEIAQFRQPSLMF